MHDKLVSFQQFSMYFRLGKEGPSEVPRGMALDRLDTYGYDTSYTQWGVEDRGNTLLQHQQQRLARNVTPITVDQLHHGH